MATKLDMEIDALHRIGSKLNIYGDRSPESFGYNGQDETPYDARHFNYWIRKVESDQLELCIDTYSTEGVTPFDVDEWEARMITFSSAMTRACFRDLSRIGRCVVGGKTVVINSLNLKVTLSGVTEATQ